jgi:hypothetical protein
MDDGLPHVKSDAPGMHIMTGLLARTSQVFASLVFLALLGVALQAHAQRTDPNAPVEDPDAGAVKETTLLQQHPRIEGRIDIPDKRGFISMKSRCVG